MKRSFIADDIVREMKLKEKYNKLGGMVMIKVRATGEYERMGLNDNELGRIPKEGEEWEVTQERFDVLSGYNKYKAVFVKKIENDVQEVETATKKIKTEKAVKKTTKKTK